MIIVKQIIQFQFNGYDCFILSTIVWMLIIYAQIKILLSYLAGLNIKNLKLNVAYEQNLIALNYSYLWA